MERISKTAFIKLEQCSKAFYFYKKHPGLADPLSREKRMVFGRGIHVGKLAQQWRPGGLDVTEKYPRKTEEALVYTRELIASGQTVIYEATFQHQGATVMIDILYKTALGWVACEVKSSLRISEVYVKDACYQYYVLKHCLDDFYDFELATLNPNYIYDGQTLDMAQLFKVISIKKDGEKNLAYFDHRLQTAALLLEQNKIPDVPIGPQCFSPYLCDYFGTCWKNEPEDRVTDLGKMSKQEQFQWYGKGMKRIAELDPAAFKHEVAIQIRAFQENIEVIREQEIRKLLQRVQGSICALDIEVWTPAIPYYPHTRPYEQIPFLYSISVPSGDHIANSYYLKPIEEDRREEFLQHMLQATESYDTILVFDRSMEETVLMQLEVLYPQHKKAIRNMTRKMVDLAELVHKAWYYHPDMKGQFSLKALAKALFQFDFEQLPINSGIVAMYTYEQLLRPAEGLYDGQETLKQQLTNYCHADTEMTLRFYTYLLDKIKNLP